MSKLQTEILKLLEQRLAKAGDEVVQIPSVLARFLAGLVASLMTSFYISLFISIILFWRLFLWKPFGNFLDVISNRWSTMPENFQFLILGFVGAVLSGIIVDIVSYFILRKIKNLFKEV